MLEYETVKNRFHPMVYVSRRSSMDPAEIAKAMDPAFGAPGAFLGRKGITPFRPPLAICRARDGNEMTVEVGFPAPEARVGAAGPNVKAGRTPWGKALRAVHRGPDSGLRETFGLLEEYLGVQGIKMPDHSWEAYVGEPATSPEITETCLPL